MWEVEKFKSHDTWKNIQIQNSIDDIIIKFVHVIFSLTYSVESGGFNPRVAQSPLYHKQK